MKRTKKRKDILITLVSALERGYLRPTFHAQERMRERAILFSDLEEAIYGGVREEHKDEFNEESGDWKYAVHGLNCSGDKNIRIIVVLKDPYTLILTVIDLNQRDQI